jgi:hypothetical protein
LFIKLIHGRGSLFHASIELWHTSWNQEKAYPTKQKLSLKVLHSSGG